MPSIPSVIQGQSAVTEHKLRGFGSAFAVNLAIFHARFGGKPWAKYFHFDLNAGSGFNDEAGCIGSPLAFLCTARQREVSNYRAFFVDIADGSVESLLRRSEIAQDSRSFVVHGDNAAFVPSIPSIIEAAGDRPEMAIGSVLVDDNGTGIAVREIADLSASCPKLDMFINVTATGLKRAFQHRGLRLSNIVGAIDKKFWLIREPIGAFQWTMLLGRNVTVGDHKALGFHHLDSPRGQEIFDRCGFTSRERKAQSTLAQAGLF